VNDPIKWIISSLIAGAVLLFGGGVATGWLSSIRSDASFHERVERDMADGEKRQKQLDDIISRQAAMGASIMVNNDQISNLQDLVHELVAAQTRQTDKIDLLVQSQMREGRINR
jgi:hypothetical protein